jgi:hypothetical protein
MPLLDISLQALSIIEIRSPRLLPKAMYAICVFGVSVAGIEEEMESFTVDIAAAIGCWVHDIGSPSVEYGRRETIEEAALC